MVDYSKWKEIEISDDEDETHPNVDTPSLFRWRHQARVERMEEAKEERKKFDEEKKLHTKKIEEVESKIKEAEAKGSSEAEDLKRQLEGLKITEEKLKKKELEFKQKDKLTPWNVDTISNPGFTKTVINKPAKRKEENLTEEEKEERMRVFVKTNEKQLKQYGMLHKFDDSKKFLLENPQLVCEDTANYLVIWCINLEMEEKHTLMEHVAHQCICMQYILELSKQLDVDPRACISSFFTKIKVAEVEYKESFEDEKKSFIERIRKRAKEKLEIAIREEEEKERQARLGPGGLDPMEVFDALPAELQKCFESQDIGLLQETIAKMPESEAAYHMKRCVDSGLWVPEGGKKEEQPATPAAAPAEESQSP